MSATPQNTQTIEVELSIEQEMSITEASKVSGMSRDEIARRALKNLLKEIKNGGPGHYHVTI
jgi:hypothetical protein